MRTTVLSTLFLTAISALPQTPALTSQSSQSEFYSELIKYSQNLSLHPMIQQRDTRSIVDSYTMYKSVYNSASIGEIPFAIGTWQTLRTGQYALPPSQTFGPYQFLRSGLAAQHAIGSITDTEYVDLAGKVLQLEGLKNGKVFTPKDQGAVIQALPQMRSLFQVRGYSPAEADAAAISAWKVTIESVSATHLYNITAPRLLSVGRELGRLVVSSEPAEAQVEVDGVRWSDRTTVSDFVLAREVRIKLSKDGYETITENFKVTRDKRNEFKRQLKPIR